MFERKRVYLTSKPDIQESVDPQTEGSSYSYQKWEIPNGHPPSVFSLSLSLSFSPPLSLPLSLILQKFLVLVLVNVNVTKISLNPGRSRKPLCFSRNQWTTKIRPPFVWKKLSPDRTVIEKYPPHTPRITRHTAICPRGHCSKEMVRFPQIFCRSRVS